MTQRELRDLLNNLKEGRQSVDEVITALKKAPFENIGYARIDSHRGIRQRSNEVIYCEGKTPEQITGIASAMLAQGDSAILLTRLDAAKADKVLPQLTNASASLPIEYDKEARIAILGQCPPPDGHGTIVIATAGTSDIPVAKEAAMTAKFLGNRVNCLYDAGVAGLHRILSSLDSLMDATVIIAIAGMEGALPGVIAGLVDVPVIAVPTSIGYGASFNGLAALLTMLNSCAAGISVVNIDNGFGAAFQASLINHIQSQSEKS